MVLSPLPVTFFEGSGNSQGQGRISTVEIARSLLGARLVHRRPGEAGQPDQILAGIIVETEAYQGESDLACHARAGLTARTAVMYGPGGRAYIYFIYGMHWMLNCVTGPPGVPEAILIRALLPTDGLAEMARRRGIDPAGRQPPAAWTNGPARLCQAMAIDGRLNGVNLTDPSSELVIEGGPPIAEERITAGPRVGIERVPEPWRSQPWRFRLRDRPLMNGERSA